MNPLRRFFSTKPPPGRTRLIRDDVPLAYAVGDVHGRLDLLLRLEEQIQRDVAQLGMRAVIVYLGDLIDRGPQSAQLLDHLLATPAAIERICLAGNHEDMMLRFCAAPSRRDIWLGNGGYETLVSYTGAAAPVDRALHDGRLLSPLVNTAIPPAHLAFLAGLPVMLRLGPFILVHAGLRPDRPLDRQSDADLTLYRGVAPILPDLTIVHGHTPVAAPLVTAGEINLDTGAFATGRLTAARLTAAGEVTVFSVT